MAKDGGLREGTLTKRAGIPLDDAHPFMDEQARLSSVLTGVAGEYFVGAELSRRGYVASITLRNTRGIDLLVSNVDASKAVGIQVKTKQGKARDWILNQKVEDYHSDSLFYIFVNLPEDGSPPEFFIVPSKVVATHAKEYHQQWLAAPGKKGQKHRDNPMRKFHDKDGVFLNKWDLLALKSLAR